LIFSPSIIGSTEVVGTGLVFSAPAPTPERQRPALLDTRTGEALLTTAEAADFLGLSPRTLEGLRRKGGGPAFVALSRNVVRYQPSALRSWIESRSVPHTAKARAVLAA